jgi:DNA-binding SARP family transcriptional activator/tetratricopeptide (TPR) repeat protein
VSVQGERTLPGLSLAGALLARPRLEGRLDETFARRLVTVTAGAGYGKTTLLAQWSRDVECAWHTASRADGRLGSLVAALARALGSWIESLPLGDAAALTAPDDALRASAIATRLAAQLERSLAHDLVLVIDDVHELAGSPSGQLVESLVRQAPPLLHVVLASREELPFRIERLRGQGQVLELVASELAFTAKETGELVELSVGAGGAPLAPRLYELTQGWPAAVRLALGALERVENAGRERMLERLRQPEGPLLSYLAQEVFEQQPPTVRRLIRSLAPFDRFTSDLCEALGIADCREAIGSLTRQGLFLSAHDSGPTFFSLHALVREFAEERLPLDEEERAALHARAAAWFEERGMLDEALDACRQSRDELRLARFLAERGAELLSHGSIDAVVEAGASLPTGLRDERLEEILGEAHSLKGDWDEGLACYERASGGRDELPPGLAWRMGRLYWDRGEIDSAARVWEQGRVDGSSPAEEGLLLAWTASPYRSSGDLERAEQLAMQALQAAERSGSPRALAAAHNAVGHNYLGRDNARFERHLAAAVEAAEAAGDVLQLVRFIINRCGPAEPRDAIEPLGEAIALAELAGAELYLARALNARGENYLALGRFGDAAADLRRSLTLWEKHGSARRAWALMSLASVARQRGDLAFARIAYSEALEISTDAEGLINAQSGLARTLAYQEPEEARRLAAAAVEEGRRLGYMLGQALLAAGWVALARGDDEEARGFAREASTETHRQRLPFEYAEALELEVMASPEPSQATERLEEALTVWRGVGNEVAIARVELAIARLRSDHPLAERARRRLSAAGVRDQAGGAAGLLGCLPAEEPEPVRIRTLGSFGALRNGQAVQVGEWRSRKARDLLKILVARRGRPAPRDYLMEALWPGEDPARLGNRLSVALSLLRAVLDPERRFGPEHYVAGGKTGVTLHLDVLPVDVEEFLADAEAGLSLVRQGSEEEARERLLAAEAAYAGDFLEEDAYQEWAAVLREEARVAYVAVAHALAELAGRGGDLDGSARYLLHVIERDPYDEKAHLALVATLAGAGHHGEARRCYATYSARMEEIGVEATPYPSTTRS